MKSKTRKKWNALVKKFSKWVAALIISTFCIACGTTKAVISKPAEGTQTTITITTNNPITTNTNPEIKWDKQ